MSPPATKENEQVAKIYDETVKSSDTAPSIDNTRRKAQASTAARWTVYLSFIFIIPLLLYIAKRNSFVRLQTRINEAASGIDVQLKNRRDTLVKLVDATKGSMNFEKQVLTQVTAMRSAKIDASTRTEVDQTLTNLSRAINVTVENYPNLRSTEAVKQLMDASYSLEQELAATRRLYNAYVRDFNGQLFTFPSNVPATDLKLETLPLFAASEDDRRDVKVDLAV